MIITGFKLKWIPSNVMGTSVDSATGALAVSCLNPLLIYEDIDTQNIGGLDLDNILVKDNNWLWDPKRTHKVYRNNRPLAA